MSHTIGLLIEELVGLRCLDIPAYEFMRKILQTVKRAIKVSHTPESDSGPLGKLSKLYLDLNNHTHDIDLHSIFPLPSLTDSTVNACPIGVYDLDLGSLELELERLVLTNCTLPLVDITDLLNACGSLNHFQYQWADGGCTRFERPYRLLELDISSDAVDDDGDAM